MGDHQILKDVCELIVDCEHKTAITQDTGFPSIRTPNIGRGRLKLKHVNRVSEEIYKQWTRRAVPKVKDLILAREAPIGNVAIVPEKIKLCLGQRTVLIRPNKNKIYPEYLLYLLLGDKIQHRIIAISSGATVPHLNMADIRKLKLPSLPLYKTQQQIASILSAYDDLIENNNRRITILEEMAQRIYKEWFVDFHYPGHENDKLVESELGMIPKDWQIKRLDEIVTFINSTTSAGDHLRNLYYLPIDCLPKKSLCVREVKSWIEAQSSLQLFEKGDILFGAMRPYFHKVIVSPFNGVTRKTCFVLRSKDKSFSSYSALTMFQDSSVAYANSHTKGSTIPYTVWNNGLDKMPVIMPVQSLLNIFKAIVDPMLKEIHNFFYQYQNLRQTRDLLLPKLISGKVDVSELEIDIGAEA